MNQLINEKISVITVFNKDKRTIFPYKINWNGRVYKITKLGFHHKIWQGKILQHIFSVTDGKIFMRLKLDTQTLHWTLEEVSDGLAA